MFGAHLGSGRTKVVAVADIGSGSAGVAILSLKSGAPATVLSSEHLVLPMETRTEEAKVAGVMELIQKAGESALKNFAAQGGKGEIRELFAVVRAPWSRSQTTHVSSSFPQETVISERIIGDLAKKTLAEVHDFDQKNMLEAKVVCVELNGYASDKPEGKRARDITVFALASDSPAGVKSKIETALQKNFPQIVPAFRSFAMTAVTVLLEHNTGERDYFVIDMSGEGTNFAAVREGVVTENVLVEEGVRTILKRVSDTGTPEETLTLMRMLSLDQCSEAVCEKIQASLARTEPDLVRVFGEAVGKCAAKRRLPNNLVLIAHPDMSLWLTRFFSRIDFAQFTETTQPFQVDPLSVADLGAWVVPQPGYPLDGGLALAGALVNIEHSRT